MRRAIWTNRKLWFWQEKRQALTYSLPSGVEEFAPTAVTSFRCNEQGGYFADVETQCKLFHVCLPQELANGSRQVSQFTFACGNQTVFNQFSLTCAHPDVSADLRSLQAEITHFCSPLKQDAIPCESSTEFFYLNERVSASEKVNLHSDDDLVKLSALLTKN